MNTITRLNLLVSSKCPLCSATTITSLPHQCLAPQQIRKVRWTYQNLTPVSGVDMYL